MRLKIRGYQFIGLFVIFCIIPPASTLADGCVDCHKNPALRIQQPNLFRYYNEWLESKHQKAGVTCSNCHGGTPTATTKEEAHNGGFIPSDPSSKVYYKNLPQTCGKCHQDIYSSFVKSKHYKALINEEAAPHCATCHGSINSRPISRASSVLPVRPAITPSIQAYRRSPSRLRTYCNALICPRVIWDGLNFIISTRNGQRKPRRLSDSILGSAIPGIGSNWTSARVIRSNY